MTAQRSTQVHYWSNPFCHSLTVIIQMCLTPLWCFCLLQDSNPTPSHDLPDTLLTWVSYIGTVLSSVSLIIIIITYLAEKWVLITLANHNYKYLNYFKATLCSYTISTLRNSPHEELWLNKQSCLSRVSSFQPVQLIASCKASPPPFVSQHSHKTSLHCHHLHRTLHLMPILYAL